MLLEEEMNISWTFFSLVFIETFPVAEAGFGLLIFLLRFHMCYEYSLLSHLATRTFVVTCKRTVDNQAVSPWDLIVITVRPKGSLLKCVIYLERPNQGEGAGNYRNTRHLSVVGHLSPLIRRSKRLR